MPRPPATPSPHRFVIKTERPPPRSTPLAQEQQTHAAPEHPAVQRDAALHLLLDALFDSVADSSSNHAVCGSVLDAQLSSDDGPQHIQELIETEEQDVDAEGYDSTDLEEEGYKLEEPSPKRRRLSTSPADVDELRDDEEEQQQAPPESENYEAPYSSSLPVLSSPPAPRRPISSTAPRFLLSTPAPQSTPRDPTLVSQLAIPFLKPPRFRPPDPSETAQTQTDPLPEQFSPLRRGQKYVVGGLAAEVRDWLMNLEGALSGTREKRGKVDQWLVRIKIDEVSEGSRDEFTMVRGRQLHVLNDEMEGEGEIADTVGIVKVMLAGEGQANGLQRGSNVEVGKTVGVKGPVWEVVIEGEKWGVGVDWKVLS